MLWCVKKFENYKRRGVLHLGNMVFLWTACLSFKRRQWSFSSTVIGGEQQEVPTGLPDKSPTCDPHLNECCNSRSQQRICWHIGVVPGIVV